jgi:hypothetical protein
MRELERQQKEQEENADRQFDMLAEPMVRTARTSTAGSRYLSSRRSSEDSLEDGGGLRDLRVRPVSKSLILSFFKNNRKVKGRSM